MSTGRVLWVIWCCAWAGAWAVAAFIDWPRRACVMYQMINPGCMAYGAVGSAARAALFALAAGVSLVLVGLPVGKAGGE